MIVVKRDVLIFTDEHLRLALLAFSTAAEVCRRRDGFESRQLANVVAALRSAMAANGQTAIVEEAGEDADLVTTDQVAVLLGCSARTARRRARELGRKVAGRWLTSTLAIREHLDERNTR